MSSRIPTQDEIAQLPRRGIVAFAAWCARKVLPAFYQWDGASEPSIDDVWSAIEVAEAHAEDRSFDADRTKVAARKAREVESVAIHDFSADSTWHDAANAAFAAAAAAFAADATYAAAAAPYASSGPEAPSSPTIIGDEAAVRASAARAAEAAARAAELAARVGATGIRRDFDRLRTVCQSEDWTDETPVPPEFFIQLEPDPIEFLADPGSASAEEIGQLFESLSQLYRQLGGDSDLEFRVEDCREPVTAEVL